MKHADDAVITTKPGLIREFYDSRETRVVVRETMKPGEEPQVWLFTGGRDVLLSVEEAERLATDLNAFVLRSKMSR